MKTALYCQIGAQAPALIRLLPMGEVVLGDGRKPFQVTPESLAKIAEAWKLRGNDMVIDYEHQTISGGEAPAAGWIKGLRTEADGLWAEVLWTDRAKEYIENREYRYFSPVVHLDENRVVEDLLHVALTNFPAMSRMSPLVLQHQGLEDLSFMRGGEKAETEVTREERRGGEGVNNMRDEGMLADDLGRGVGLQEDAAKTQVPAMVHELVQAGDRHRVFGAGDILRLLGLAENEAPAKALERIEVLRSEAGRVSVLEEEIRVLKQEQSLFRKERLLQEALGARKTTPAELDLGNGRLRRLAQDDPEFFVELILSRPDNWAIPGPLGEGPWSVAALSGEESTLCAAFGIEREAYLKNRVKFEKGE